MANPKYRLRLDKLKFCSIVDNPAQPNAKTLLIKRAPKGDQVEATARFVKVSDELGLAFFWAFTSTNADGTPHHDLQGDQVTSGDEMIKAAADFMTDGGGAVDEMHDEQPGAGKVVFAMPMNQEIASAFGVTSKTEGLMIAIRPAADVMAKLKNGTYNGVSIGGTGYREAVKRNELAKYLFARVLKEAVLTSEEDGHQHALDLDDPATSWCDMYSTSYQTLEGAENSHSHAWTFDATSGAITIAADSGHTHTVAAVVPPDALAAWAKLDAIQDAENEAVAAIPVAVVLDAEPAIAPILVEEPSSQTIVVNVAARAPASKSTPGTLPNKVATQPETKPMNLAKMLAIVLAMSDTQRAHVAKLAPDEVESFFTKSAPERDAIFKSAEAADPVVFKGEKTGVEVHKSDGPFALKMAQNAETSAIALAKAEEQVAAEKAARELVELTKLANDTLGCLAGTDGAHVDVLRAVQAITDTAKRDAAITTLKAANAVMKAAGKPNGVTDAANPVSIGKSEAYSALTKALMPFCEEKKITKVWTEGLAAFAATPAGAVLVKAYDDAKAAA